MYIENTIFSTDTFSGHSSLYTNTYLPNKIITGSDVNEQTESGWGLFLPGILRIVYMGLLVNTLAKLQSKLRAIQNTELPVCDPVGERGIIKNM